MVLCCTSSITGIPSSALVLFLASHQVHRKHMIIAPSTLFKFRMQCTISRGDVISSSFTLTLSKLRAHKHFFTTLHLRMQCPPSSSRRLHTGHLVSTSFTRQTIMGKPPQKLLHLGMVLGVLEAWPFQYHISRRRRACCTMFLDLFIFPIVLQDMISRLDRENSFRVKVPSWEVFFTLPNGNGQNVLHIIISKNICDHLLIPGARVWINEIRNLGKDGRSSRCDWSSSSSPWKQRILPYINMITITHSPNHAIFKRFKASYSAPP